MPPLQQLLGQVTALVKTTARDLSRQRRLARARLLSEETEAEYWRCHPDRGAEGFRAFCETYVHLWDHERRCDVPMELFDSQRIVSAPLVDRTWLVLLKGRQLGLTWLLAAYVLWNVIYRRRFVIVVVNQQLRYAKDFIWRVRYIHRRLPPWLQKTLTTRNKQELRWEADGNSIELHAIVGGENAGRSMTVDLAILDEASRIPDLDETLAAIEPCVRSANGQMVALSSSAGPQGFFYEAWHGAYGEDGELIRPDGTGPNGFRPIFLHWSTRRGRDAAWYAREAEILGAISPVRMKQEHPDTPQEAWEFASGRVYPLFRRDPCVGDIEAPLNMERYRAIDWGQTDSPFVCLWIGHVPGPPGFLVSPACPNTIREFFSYRWDEDDPNEPLKQDDHAPDAIRYAVTTYNLKGLVYVYRELYIEDSVAKGWNVMKEIERIHELSGWVEAEPERRQRWRRGRDGEAYEGTVADRSWSLMIKTYTDNDIPCRGHKVLRKKDVDKRLTDPPRTEKLEGIRMVSALIDGSIDLEKRMPVTRERLAQQQQQRATPYPLAASLQERALHRMAQRLARVAEGRR